MHVLNPDDILSAFFARLNSDTGPGGFATLVNSIDKGAKRRNPPPGEPRVINPSATVHVLTSPLDEELGTYRSTVVVNVYMDDLTTGQMDAQGLGLRAQRVQYLFHKAHLPTHPEGPLQRPGLRFHTVYVAE